MAILIEGIEIPEEQFQKSSTWYYVEGTIFVYPNGKARAELSVDYKERKSYPIVPVPNQHGRLIDADTLGSFPYNMDFCDGGEADEWIQNAPTIIPARKEE